MFDYFSTPGTLGSLEEKKKEKKIKITEYYFTTCILKWEVR